MMSNYAARFVSGLVGNPEDRFSEVAAQITITVVKLIQKCLQFHYVGI